MLFLCPKGYRIVSACFPAYRQLSDFVRGLSAFMKFLGVDKTHLMGVSLGGFLAQVFAQQKPQEVQSLVLVNTFCDARPYHEAAPCREM